MTRIMISAGEASGDVHAGALARAIFKLDPQAEVYGMGGDNLRQAGGEVVFDIKDHGVMGFVEVVKKLPAILKLRNDFRQLMQERRPDCLVVIDYPDFNMRIAAIAKEMGIPIVSFISPSAWAWRKGRAKKVAALVNKVAAIFPFEYDVYKEAGADTEFVGHPLVDIVHPTLPKEEAVKLAGKKVGHHLVLLLPGSRFKEIETMLPPMLQAAKLIKRSDPSVDFIMPRAATIPPSLLQGHMDAQGMQVRIVEGNIYDIMSVADVALATSGTVTLEAALCGLPSVICYQTAYLLGLILRAVLSIKCIGLPNIVAGTPILPELLQEQMTPQNMAREVLRFLEPEEASRIRRELLQIKKRLGEPGAVERVARLTLKLAGDKK